MSDFPSTECPHAGKKPHYVYPALRKNGDRSGKRVKLCDQCFDDWVTDMHAHTIVGIPPRLAFLKRPESCDWEPTCDAKPDGAVLFATAFYDKDEKVEFVARLCELHEAEARHLAFWGT